MKTYDRLAPSSRHRTIQRVAHGDVPTKALQLRQGDFKVR